MDRDDLAGLLNLREQMVPAGQANRPGTRIASAFITTHNASNDNPAANAAAHARFVMQTGCHTPPSGKKHQVSWHYSADDREAVQHLPLNAKGFRAGPGNSVGKGIEVCMHRGIDQAARNERAARLAALLASGLGLGAGKLRTHKRWTGKACPALLLPLWAAFAGMVEAVRAGVTGASGVAESLSDGGWMDEAAVMESAGFDNAEIDHDALAEALNAGGLSAGVVDAVRLVRCVALRCGWRGAVGAVRCVALRLARCGWRSDATPVPSPSSSRA